jgi:hypothetical protein
MDVWPPLPLFVRCHEPEEAAESVDNTVAVLGEHSDRVCDLDIIGPERSDLEKLLAAVQVPFPELTYLRLWLSDIETPPVLPASFLGGSAPRLKYIWFGGVPFPSLPKLLLSATHLVSLSLEDIPHSGYISPEAIVTALSTLTRLTALRLLLESPQSFPDRARQRPPPPTHSALPALTYFYFRGVSEYLEVIMARIDTPRLNNLCVILFNDIVFDIPQFTQFVGRTPMLKPLEKAHFTFEDDTVIITLSSPASGKDESLEVGIICSELHWQVSSMKQICTTLCLRPFSTLEDLHFFEDLQWRELEDWPDNIENALWLELLHPFTSVKNLYLSEYIAQHIVPSLQDLVGGKATEVLPTLQNIFLEELQPSGPVQEGIQQFVSRRQATGHPIAIFYGQKVR